jgi:hypothetical protein
MMLKQLVVLCFFSLLIPQNNCLARKNVKIKPANVRPYDMLDDAQALIDDLNQLVLGKIFAAHDNLDDLNMEIVSYSINVRLNAEIDINQEYLTVEEELSNVKELGESTGKDISSCLDGTEDQINQLPDGYVQQINQCVSDLQEEFKDFLSDRRYKTDVVINTVQQLSFKLGQCSSDDIDCIMNIIDSIEGYEENLPLLIAVEVTKAEENKEIVKAKIQQCSDTGLTGFVQDVTSLLGEITDCVNSIVS